MQLQASCEINFEADAPVAVILMLRPRSGAAQWVSREEYDFTPRLPVVEYTDIFANLCQRVVIPAGHTRVLARCTVDTADTVDVDHSAAYLPPELLPDDVLPFILPTRYCPSDQLGQAAQEIVAGATPGYGQVDAIRAWINREIKYQHGSSTPATTALDTYQTRVGVCRDFTHLGLALCRALNIPARMVVGYTLALDEPDLHAWFEAYVGGRWFAFDAVLDEGTTGNRIAIAYGRDATDVAFVTQFGPLRLNRMTVVVTPTQS